MFKKFTFLLLLSSLILLKKGIVYADTIPVTHESFQQELQECLRVGSGKFYIISKDGTGDFSSIQDGVNEAFDGDVLIINPGEYDEYVRISNKTLYLLGIDTDKCIIKNYADRYENASVIMGKGRLYNLTIYAFMDKENRINDNQIDITKVAESRGNQELKEAIHQKALGYAIHADQEDMLDSELRIVNCKIISDANQCLGFGARKGHTAIIQNCDIVSSSQGGCVYYHNTDYAQKVDKSKLMFYDTSFTNYLSPYIFSLHSLTDNHPVEITFVNNKIKTVAFDYKKVYSRNNTYIGKTILERIDQKDEFIKIYPVEESLSYIHRLKENEDTLGFNPNLSEGITYFEMDHEIQDSDQDRIPTVYEIYNFDGKIGDGWLGLEGFILQNVSSGNTLPEMNYGSGE